MPVINFNYTDLCRLIGQEVPKEILIERIPMLGADMQDTIDSDEMSVEFFPSRPDLFSVEGLARALRAFLGIEPGMKSYETSSSGITLNVDPNVIDVRPEIVAAAVADVKIDDAFIRSLMELQEKLHVTIGRKRAKVAIGVHDLDKVNPPFLYEAVEPEKVSFVPLGKTESWNLCEILEYHEKGREYAHLMKDKERYPLITDINGKVLSFPPIINGTLTTVTEKTRNLFIDVTGTDMKAVEGALNILTTALAERGGKIETVSIEGTYQRLTPDLTPSHWELDVDSCNVFLGVALSPEEMAKSMRLMGYDAAVDNKKLSIFAPATRMDLLHPVDIMEDVAIGYGYEHFGSVPVMTQTFGSELPCTELADGIRDIMTGLSFFEVTTLILSNPEDEFQKTGLKEVRTVKVKNPISEEYTCMRANLIPSMMRVLRRNKHRDLPQNIFEVGDVLDWCRCHRHVAALSVHSRANFTEMKSVAEALLREMGMTWELKPCDLPLYISGRGAAIIIEGEERGHFGEVSPAVITAFELNHPMTALELDLGPKLC